MVPSPNSHRQDIGFPAEESKNCTARPAVGYWGLHLKDPLRLSAFFAARRESKLSEPVIVVCALAFVVKIFKQPPIITRVAMIALAVYGCVELLGIFLCLLPVLFHWVIASSSLCLAGKKG